MVRWVLKIWILILNDNFSIFKLTDDHVSSRGQELLDCLVPDAAVATGDDDVAAVLIRQIWNKKILWNKFLWL